MPTGSIEYAVPLAGLRLERTVISSSHPAVENISLETQNDERMVIVFHLINIFTFEQAEEIARDLLPSIVNKLAYHRDLRVGDPYQIGGTIPQDSSGSTHIVRRDVLLMSDSAVAIVAPNETGRRELAMLLEQPYRHNELYSAYRFALNQSDAVARFMFLYNILLQLNNDEQKQVDDFIRGEAPSVSQSPRPDRPRVIETIYTRLRNEVGHRRQGVTPEQTRGEIEGSVGTLQALVKTGITQVV